MSIEDNKGWVKIELGDNPELDNDIYTDEKTDTQWIKTGIKGWRESEKVATADINTRIIRTQMTTELLLESIKQLGKLQLNSDSSKLNEIIQTKFALLLDELVRRAEHKAEHKGGQ